LFSRVARPFKSGAECAALRQTAIGIGIGGAGMRRSLAAAAAAAAAKAA
jgi:hypothetical protein